VAEPNVEKKSEKYGGNSDSYFENFRGLREGAPQIHT
jgi:hypothetical protein